MPKIVFKNRPYRILGVAVDYDVYLKLRSISTSKGVSLSDLLREIIYEYLEKHGLMEKEVTITDSGLNLQNQFISIADRLELEECINYLKRDIEIMKSSVPKSKDWINANFRIRKVIRKVKSIMAKGSILNRKQIEEAIKLIKEYEKCLKNDLNDESPYFSQ